MSLFTKNLYCLILTVVLVGCTATGADVPNVPSGKSMSQKENYSKMKLTGKARVENETLFVDYTVENQSAGSVYVFDEMIEYDDQAKPKINRNIAYCFWEEPETLRLVRATLQIPKEKDVYSLEIPYAREIKPMESVGGKIELKFPIDERSPFYAPPNEENSVLRDCKKIRLIVGWTEPASGTNISEANVGGEKVVRIRGNWRPELVTETFNVSTKVRAHTDTFDRQLPAN